MATVPQAPLSRRESQARTREAIVAAAEQVFLEKGFRATSVGEIARAAGYTTGAVYSNFEGKEQLALAVLERRTLQIAGVAGRRLQDAGPTPAGRLAAVSQVFDEVLGDEPWAVFAAEFVLAGRSDPELREQFRLQMTGARRLIALLLADPSLEADRRLAPDRMADIVFALGIGLSVLRVTDPDVEPGLLGAALTALLRGD